MAISKSYTAPTGVSGTYWQTHVLEISPDYSMVRFSMDLYASQAAALANSAPLYRKDVVWSTQDGSNPLGGLPGIRNLIETTLVAQAGIWNGGTVSSG